MLVSQLAFRRLIEVPFVRVLSAGPFESELDLESASDPLLGSAPPASMLLLSSSTSGSSAAGSILGLKSLGEARGLDLSSTRVVGRSFFARKDSGELSTTFPPVPAPLVAVAPFGPDVKVPTPPPSSIPPAPRLMARLSLDQLDCVPRAVGVLPANALSNSFESDIPNASSSSSESLSSSAPSPPPAQFPELALASTPVERGLSLVLDKVDDEVRRSISGRFSVLAVGVWGWGETEDEELEEKTGRAFTRDTGDERAEVEGRDAVSRLGELPRRFMKSRD